MINVADVLSRKGHLAIAWAEAQAADVLASGKPLTPAQAVRARAVGVSDPGRVRIKVVADLPEPADDELRAAAIQEGLLGPQTHGITFGHGVIIRRGHEDNRLVSHELRHVYQYEAAGSIASFLPVYLKQIIDYKYENAPLEIDARQHETDAS